MRRWIPLTADAARLEACSEYGVEFAFVENLAFGRRTIDALVGCAGGERKLIRRYSEDLACT